MPIAAVPHVEGGTTPRHLARLDPEQLAAATSTAERLLVVAGAGTGKTRTLVGRVAHLVHEGATPERILLLTFTRRAAQEMIRRARTTTGDDRLRRVRGGTFHSVAHATLRRHGAAVGLVPGFSILDEGDVRDVIALVRSESGLATSEARFPRPDAIASVASRVANAREPLSKAVDKAAPWCVPHVDAIREILRGVRDRKRAINAVDFDDLLLYWHALLHDDAVAPRLQAEFDHVLVDEFQDTNRVQAEILTRLTAGGAHLTVVGDDAQSIYGFRAATVANILDFPREHAGAEVVTLERNYRSTQPILDVANAVMAGAARAHHKTLRTQRDGTGRPVLVTCTDEAAQSDAVCDAILDLREQGVALRDQAVLVRTAQHSGPLELECARRDIPFHKFGGLKFLQAAHVKDLAAMLRLLDNPADELAWHRVLRLVDGIGPARQRTLLASLGVGDWRPADDRSHSPMARLLDGAGDAPARAEPDLEALVSAWATALSAPTVAGQLGALAVACRRLWTRAYDDAVVRLGDVDRLAALAGDSTDRGHFLTDLTLDPPSSTSDLAGPPHLDDDWLTISTIHSAKGLEWDAVHLLHVTDGNIPSDMALRDRDELEEERRLLYVALTRSRDHLRLHAPVRYHVDRFGTKARNGFAPLSRFLTGLEDRFDQERAGVTEPEVTALAGARGATTVDADLDALWDR